MSQKVIQPVPDTGVGPVPVPGEPVELAPGLVRLTAPNPGLMTGPGTNSYVIGSGDELAVIDPGPADESHLAALLAAVDARGTLRSILVTHTHLDHAPGAAALAQATGAQVVGFGPAENFDPDLCVRGGWTLTLPGPGNGDGNGHGAVAELTLEAVHTPGHASDHICWLLKESRTLLTGDHLMHGSTVVIRPPDGDLGTVPGQSGPGARLRAADPPAGTRSRPGDERVSEVVDALVAHRLGRHARVADALGAMGEGTVEELLPRSTPTSPKRSSRWRRSPCGPTSGIWARRAGPSRSAGAAGRTPSRPGGAWELPIPSDLDLVQPGRRRWRRRPDPLDQAG